MSDFKSAYALSGEGYDHWDKTRTEKELRLHLFEVGYRLERVLQSKGKTDDEKNKDKEELSKETADLVILAKHFALSFGGGEEMLATRHAKFRRQ